MTKKDLEYDLGPRGATEAVGARVAGRLTVHNDATDRSAFVGGVVTVPSAGARHRYLGAEVATEGGKLVGRLHFHVLGALEVTGPRTVPITSHRDRIVLAMLLLRPNRIVSVDRLVDGVWSDSPPSTARRQIQSCVVRLRRILRPVSDHEIIVTAYPGYLLRPGVHTSDHWEFVSRIGDLTAAAESGPVDWSALADDIRGALSLWRGPALEGINSPAVEAEAARLEEMRLAAVEWLMDVELTAGRDHELIGELIPLIGSHQFRERFCEQLMVAQYRAGRRVDALATYREARTLLLAEIGSEPGANLRRLHDAVLCDDPARVRLEATSPGRRSRYPRESSYAW
ncbi:AfsR/SARP family transcriptional regulator [Nocardia sp. BMG51109]|uniref:AfsR/SARP family transcriptional regulator n=1 Tax=Nocardia sp. BMG51109 TaxID=1056816 RepID=UPI0012EB9791|nr:AfsR/SARP family transcriptional regulator [Nocardia sp. BMG51109]